ncbi:MAG: glycosyltransferase family 2 protein [Streptosporangiaceae bacterium]
MSNVDDARPAGPAAPVAKARAATPVSVIMPVRDAELLLPESVSQVLGQAYPGEIELVLAVGPSKDKTAHIAEQLAAADSRIKVVANTTGQIPNGLNAAVLASRHPVIVRVDARSRLPGNYIAIAVRTLRQTGAVNVGGVRAAEGITAFQQAVAWAMTSPFGVGSSRYNTGGSAGPSDSVYLGAFRREAIEKVGGYDERYLRAEDWEMNHRIRASGGLIWFQPELRVRYRPRGSVRELASQYFLYGRWRRVIARLHGTINVRYLTPVAMVVGVLAGLLAGLAGIFGLVAGVNGWWPVLLSACLGIPLVYVIFLLTVAVRAGTDGRIGRNSLAWLPVVLATMHICWGLGFLTSRRGLVRGPADLRPERVMRNRPGPAPGSSPAPPAPGSSPAAPAPAEPIPASALPADIPE